MLPGWWQDRHDLAASLLHGQRTLPLAELLPRIAKDGSDVLTAICR